MPINWGIYLQRTLCDVLREMRECFKTLNFAPIPGLIEEAQSMSNKMEAGLGYKRDIADLEEEYKQLKRSIELLRKEERELKDTHA